MPQAPPFETRRSHIAGVPVNQLAEKFGTPVYVYDAAQIIERIDDLRAFDGIRYAPKGLLESGDSRSDPPSRRAGRRGQRGRNRPGTGGRLSPQGDPPPIVYTADIFDRDTLDLVVRHGLHVNCGSPDMIDQLGEHAPGSQITLRLNPGFGHGHSQKTNTGGEQSKHGIWHEQLADCLRRADHHGLGVSGLHMHIGSGTDLEHLAQVSGALEKPAARSRPLADHAQHRRRLADSLSGRPNLCRSGRLFPPLGCHPPATGR